MPNTCSDVESTVEGDCGGVVDASWWDGGGKPSMARSKGCGGGRGEDEGKGSLSERGRGPTERADSIGGRGGGERKRDETGGGRGYIVTSISELILFKSQL